MVAAEGLMYESVLLFISKDQITSSIEVTTLFKIALFSSNSFSASIRPVIFSAEPITPIVFPLISMCKVA